MKKNEQKEVAKKNIHEGHRARLLDFALNAGVDNMSNFQVLEFFLTYIFPRGDVNPLAHRLLDKFETFTHVVDADLLELKAVDGINDRSAKMIKMFGELFYYYTTAKMGKRCVLSSKSEIVDLVEDHLRFRNIESFLFISLSSANIVTGKRIFKSCSSEEVGFSVLQLTQFISSTKPFSMVFAHCHPYGSAIPSEEDVHSMQVVERICHNCNVDLVDSFVVGDDGVFSMKENKMLRNFCDFDEIKQSFSQIMG